MIAVPTALAVALSLVLGTPVGGALTAAQAAALAGVALTAAPRAAIAVRQLDRFLHTPAVRAWAAASGEAAIRSRPGARSQSGI